MSDEAREIASGRRDTRIIPPLVGSELNEIANTLNSTFDRLDDTYDRQKRFTADASHELGTPVSIIISQTQLALGKPRSPGEYTAALECCAGQRMCVLTHDLLDLAEYDAGIPQQQLVSCDLAEIARDISAEAQPVADQHSARIIEHLEPACGHLHPAAIGQVFSNLIRNAIKHNPHGITVTITTRTCAEGVTAEVRDTGTGIPAADLPRIFDRYHRGDKSRSQDSGGSGLGLAICQTIIEAHRGSISVENNSEGGACFRFNLPA